MNRNLLRIAPFALVLLLLAASPLLAAPVGKITHVQGRADVLKAGWNMARPVSFGMPVDVGDVYRTKGGGKAEITFLNRNILRIAPSTRIEIKDYMVQGDRDSSIMKLHRGKAQAVSSPEFIKKVSAYAEGNRFEIHTPNAVAGIRGSNMIVFHQKGISGILFVTGKGYTYNPRMPGQIVPLTAGNITFIHSAGTPPTPPRQMTNAELQNQLNLFNTSGGSDGSSGGSGATGSGGGEADNLLDMASLGLGTASQETAPPQDTPPPPPPPPPPTDPGLVTGNEVIEGTPFIINLSIDEGFYPFPSSMDGSPWSASKMKILGKYDYNYSGDYGHMWGGEINSYMSDPLNETYTYDGGAYIGYLAGTNIPVSQNSRSLDGSFLALFVDPSGAAGILSSGLSGNVDPASLDFLAEGNLTGTVMNANIGFPAGNWTDHISSKWYGYYDDERGLEFRLTSGGPTSAYVSGAEVDALCFESEPWGIWKFKTGGTYSIEEVSSPSWKAVLGGTLYDEYWGSDTYLLAAVSNGTWQSNRISGTITGRFMDLMEIGVVNGNMIGFYGSSGEVTTWEAVGLGTFTSYPLMFAGDVSFDYLYVGDGLGYENARAYLGGISSLWSGANIPFYVMGSYPGYNPGQLWTAEVVSYNYNYDTYTTTDGGGYRGYLSILGAPGVNSGERSLIGRFLGLYFDPHADMYGFGPTGILSGSLQGTGYNDIGLFSLDGSMNRIQMGSIDLRQSTDTLILDGAWSENLYSYEGCNPIKISLGGAQDFYTFSSMGFLGPERYEPWGIYRFTAAGFSPLGSLASEGRVGGYGMFGDEFPFESPSDGYWLADFHVSETMNGKFINATRMGDIGGEVLRAYDPDYEFWEVVSQGTFTSQPLSHLGLTENGDGICDSFYTYSNNTEMNGIFGGAGSLWSGDPEPVRSIGEYYEYFEGGPDSFVPQIWYSRIYSFNYANLYWYESNNLYTTNDGGAYAGYLGGIITAAGLTERNLEGRFMGLYIDPDNSAGILLGSLTGKAYSDISDTGMYYMDGIMTSIQLGSTSIEPSNLWDSIGTGGLFYSSITSAGFDISSSSSDEIEFAFISDLPQWGVFTNNFQGTYAGTPDANFWMKMEYGTAIDNQHAVQFIYGTDWNKNRMAGEIRGYWSDISSAATARTGVLIGDCLGTFNPNDFQALSAGAWMETNKFLELARTSQEKLEVLKIPAFEVGRVDLSGSNANMTVHMNDTIFFARKSESVPRIWASGNVNGIYSGNPLNTTVTLNQVSGDTNGISAKFTMNVFDDVSSNVWRASIYDGSGKVKTSPDTINFQGVGAGNITSSSTFSGTAAGIVKK